MDLVSIISVNYNGFQDTCELIDSLAENESFFYELILVDNGSSENEADQLRQRFAIYVSEQKLKIIRSDINLGFAGGNNLGLKEAVGNFILFLNNDIIVKKPFLAALVNCFKANADVGLVSPKIKYAYDSDFIQYAGFTTLAPIILRNEIIGTRQLDNGKYDVSSITAYAHGACMMTSREVLNKVGPMAEAYFLFYEELDWSQHIKDAGYIIWYCSSVSVFHKEGMSIKKGTPLRIFFLNRGRILYARRNYKGIMCFLSCSYQIFIAFPKNFLVSLYRKEWGNVWALCRGVVHGLLDPKE